MKKTHQSTAYSGQWTRTIVADWEHNGHNGIWEYIERNASQQGVVIIPLIVSRRSVILIRQKRIPLDANVIEFPAGLVDQGETVEICVARELAEETGASGKIVHLSAPLATSPGLTSECIICAIVAVDSIHNSDLDVSEDIEMFEIPIAELDQFIEERGTTDVIDSKVWFFSKIVSGFINLLLDGAR